MFQMECEEDNHAHLRAVFKYSPGCTSLKRHSGVPGPSPASSRNAAYREPIRTAENRAAADGRLEETGRSMWRTHGRERGFQRQLFLRSKIPFGTAHLPADKVSTAEGTGSPASRSEAFAKEALRWLSDGDANASKSLAEVVRNAVGGGASRGTPSPKN